jgi:hypothetical protein
VESNIKVHSAIDDATSDAIKQVASAKGLDKINYNNCYRMYKVGNKNSESIEVIEKKCVGAGEIRLIGNEEFVSLYISGLREWFRTSPIISCNKKKNSIIIETMNSFYELKEEK